MGGKTPVGHGPAQYAGPIGTQQQQQQQYAAPPYSPPVNNNNNYYGGPNGNREVSQQQGYSGQENGIELESPANAYVPAHGGDQVYNPPVGAPPGKMDGVVR